MKVAAIGDIHGTTKFNECYEKIKLQDNDVEKIIVLGDWFDSYEDIPFETMLERYNKFIDCMHSDSRIISILGNHDLDGYVIEGQTNRTSRNQKVRKSICENIVKNLPDSYLVYKIGNYLFSHAGVSQNWMNDLPDKYKDIILTNKKGWTVNELNNICQFYAYDMSFYGNNTLQGCTWIRPDALIKSLPDGYNQVVGHTQVEKICNVRDEVKDLNLKNDVWLIDNQRKPEYLLLNIEESD